MKTAESRQAAHADTILLKIVGMSCAGCVSRVETALQDVPGVRLATVNFAGESAAVTGSVEPDQLIDAVSNVGYSASLLMDESIEVQAREARLQLHRSILRSTLALGSGALLMADMWLGWLPPVSHTPTWTVIGVLTLGIMILTGGHFFRGALNAARHFSTSMDTLIALGTGTAWCYSMIIVLLPALLPEDSRHQFFEAALFVIGFVNLGKALEVNARASASLAIRKLFDLTPDYATVLLDGKETLVPVAALERGQVIRVNPGENYPVDGEVLRGRGTASEAMLTGESGPVPKAPGDPVFAGTTNLDASLEIAVQQTGDETRLAAVSRLVSKAQNSKPAVARLVDRITRVFVPVILVVATLTVVTWMLVGPDPKLSHAMAAGMSVLIIACPCALGLAVPMSVMVGLGRGAAKGLLIRNSESLQAASHLDVVVMDKTGTLTVGEPAVQRSEGLDDQALALAAALAQGSSHPLARAVARFVGESGAQRPVISNFSNHVGGGVTAEAGDKSLVLGSLAFLEAGGVVVPGDIPPEGSIVALGIDGTWAGYFLLQDAIRPDAVKAIAALVAMGIKPVMLTGDRQQIADQIARETGITEVHAEVSPEQKLELIQRYQAGGYRVGMVGDGINDAAALSAADVGFAMGMGADIAMESADVTLRENSLEGVVESIRLSGRVLANIYQNLVAASAYNLLLVPVAAGVLYPSFGLLINPAMAGLAMALSSVSVVLNAGRLRFS